MRGMMATVAVTLALVLAIGFLCGAHSKSASEDYQVAVEEVATAIRQERWEDALTMARQAEQNWQEEGATLAMWVNHQDLDEVSLGFAQLRVSIEQRETYHALRCIAELEEGLSLIYQRDAFSLKNIL